MKQKYSKSQTEELTDLLARSARDVDDTEHLQQRICEVTRDMPQEPRSPMRWAQSLLHPFSAPRHGLALAACGLLVAVTLALSSYLWIPQSDVQIITSEPPEESTTLSEEDLPEDVIAQLVWDEVMLLEDEIAFGTF